MKENNPHILGTEKVGKLLLEYSIPAIIGMTLTSLYNIIDSVFIGHGVGAMAISGLAISFLLMNLLVAFCTLVGVGGATISSIRLAKEHIAHYWAETYHKPTDQTHPDTDDYSGLLQEVQLFFDLTTNH